MSPTAPPPHIWTSRGRTPNYSASSDSRSCPSQERFSSSSVIHCGISSYHSLGRWKTLYPLDRSGLETYAQHPEHGGGSQSFKRRDRLEGRSRGEHKATESHGPPGHGDPPTTLPSPLPQPTLGHHHSGAYGGQVRPSGQLAWIGNKVRQLQGWPHGQQRAARKLQQEYRQGAARMPQEHPGLAMRPQEWLQARQE